MKAPNSDKKKVLILGVMGVVLFGVGAFQFIGTGAPAPSSNKKETDKATQETTAEAGAAKSDNVYAGAPLTQRDPFAPQIAPKVDPNQVAANSTPKPSPTRGLDPMGAPVPPMPPMAGDMGSLPQPSQYPNGQNPGENTGNGASNGGAEPSFRLSGVVIGDRPIAVIQVDGGKQRMVRVGDSVSGQKVSSITRRGVVLEGNGQRTTLSLKGNAENNKGL